MEKPRFQFTIRDILWATFWASLTALAWAGFVSMCARGQVDTRVDMLSMVFSVAGPCVTIGALFRRTWIGIGVGLLTVVLAIPVAMVLGC